jgi:hypothetical protein
MPGPQTKMGIFPTLWRDSLTEWLRAEGQGLEITGRKRNFPRCPTILTQIRSNWFWDLVPRNETDHFPPSRAGTEHELHPTRDLTPLCPHLGDCICFCISVWWPEDKNSPNVAHACRKRRLKWVPSAWGYSWVTLSPWVTNTEAWPSRLGVGRGTHSPTLYKSCCQEIQRRNSQRLWLLREAMAHKGLSCQRKEKSVSIISDRRDEEHKLEHF